MEAPHNSSVPSTSYAQRHFHPRRKLLFAVSGQLSRTSGIPGQRKWILESLANHLPLEYPKEEPNRRRPL
ncbi:hypothetical protein OIU77_002904 [Salix suchowensis]|uniref:Uncharacterized protein n=1 Tax=Salix suchowensis TaxID=1278906 RepID=A0ABQ9AZW5_9ROSI|nr:hypothetical protein OIU77_002904 [Salix suchowensis]